MHLFQIKSQELEIHFKFEPDISLHYVYCWNNKTKQKTDADESPNYFGCFQPVRDGKYFFLSHSFCCIVHDLCCKIFIGQGYFFMISLFSQISNR